MARGYRCISADSHLEISPESWRSRVPEGYRERAPRVIRLPSGADAVVMENQPILKVWSHNAGIPWEEYGPDRPSVFEGRVGCGTPEQRMREQDEDGVDAEVLYPSVWGAGMWRSLPDDDVYHAMFRAYNDYLVEDYMAADPDRLIGMAVIPARGVEASVAELERVAKKGYKGAVLTGYPAGKGRPVPEEDRFWAAALDLAMPLTIHTQFAGGGRGSADGRLDLARRICTYGVKGAPIAAALVIDGVFERFPGLQIYIAENQLCWIPGFMEQMDLIWMRHRHYHERLQGLKPLPRRPSEYVKEHFLWGFMHDRIGVKLRHEIGVQNVMWSTDFPHDPTDWPRSQETIAHQFAGVPADETHLMIAGNAIRYFRLDAIPMQETRERETATVA